MKILPVGAELCLADGRVERHNETNRRFRQFCKRSKNKEIFAPAVKFTNTFLKTLSILKHATTHLRILCVFFYRAL